MLFVVNVGWFFLSHRLPIAVALKAAGAEVHVAASLEPGLDANTKSVLAGAGIQFHELHLSRSGAGVFELLSDAVDLARLFREVRPHIVHLITLKPVLLGGVVGRWLRLDAVVIAIPGRGSVFSARGSFAALRRSLVLFGYRMAYRPAKTRVIVQNAEDREFFVSKGVFRPQDVCLIRGSGVDLRRFAPRPEAAGIPIVVFASRMLRDKGVESFVAAAAILRANGRDARFVLVGEPDLGNPHSHTREELTAWASSGVVEWWGFRRDMEDVFAECHVVCLPTFYGEGVPKVLIEAAAAGRAIVTTDAPGCRDIVHDGNNGLLVPPRDVPRLVSALGRLIADPVERRVMGERGHRRATEEFGIDIVIKQTLELYDDLAG